MDNLKSFKIGKALYFLENNLGSKLQINVNYAKDNFELVIIADRGGLELLKRQAAFAAKNMLVRKAKKNLVHKLLELKV